MTWFLKGGTQVTFNIPWQPLCRAPADGSPVSAGASTRQADPPSAGAWRRGPLTPARAGCVTNRSRSVLDLIELDDQAATFRLLDAGRGTFADMRLASRGPVDKESCRQRLLREWLELEERYDRELARRFYATRGQARPAPPGLEVDFEHLAQAAARAKAAYIEAGNSAS
ncbi:hypothetical protein GCM10009868_31180 [Terrabacter aerolatus]|uniref:Uncharacterized protein n=1 Tax=Terrabacter aerolatus TaxID=422442 RepID=A0A512CZ01_9MICO|nr:hypothetical protein TAE01_12490 [Terrabacter aerolatus]